MTYFTEGGDKKLLSSDRIHQETDQLGGGGICSDRMGREEVLADGGGHRAPKAAPGSPLVGLTM